MKAEEGSYLLTLLSASFERHKVFKFMEGKYNKTVNSFVAIGFANAGQMLMAKYIGAGQKEKIGRFVGTMSGFWLGDALAGFTPFWIGIVFYASGRWKNVNDRRISDKNSN